MLIMADDWDDDDFGTFESADVGSPVGSTVSSSSSSAPAWLLTSQPQQVTTVPTSTEQHDKKPAINTCNQVNESDTGQDKSDIEQNILETVKEENQQMSSGDNLNSDKRHTDLFEGHDQTTKGDNEAVSSVIEVAGTDDPFADIFGGEALPTEKNDVKTIDDGSVVNTGGGSTAAPEVTLPPPNEPTVEKESVIVAELKSKLDTALILKEQAEKSVSDIREELKNTVEELNADIVRREEERSKEIECLSQQRDEEIGQVKDEAQQSMKALTEQYTNLCSRIAKEQQLQFEKQLGEITQKCVELLQLQQSTIDDRIAEEVAKRSNAVDELLDTCKRDVKEFVTSQCNDVVDRCSNASQTVEEHLKERIAEEIEKQRKIDLQSKEEAIQELTKLHKDETRHLMAEERSKFNDATRRAVEDAQKIVQSSVKQEHEQARRTQERHLLALKMLLTSSQEHLRKLTEDVAPPPDADS